MESWHWNHNGFMGKEKYRWVEREGEGQLKIWNKHFISKSIE